MGLVFNPFTAKLDFTGATPVIPNEWTFGTSVINFGAFPGNSEASVTVTGQGDIDDTAVVHVWFSRAATADHTVGDHSYASAMIGLTSSDVVNSTGFTISARCLDKMQGTFNVNWGWINV
jgi:hypothetical protein